MSDYEEDAPVEAEEFKPTVSFSAKQLPELKNWKVGSKYQLVLEVEQKSLREESYGKNKGELKGSFEVLNVKALKGKTPFEKGLTGDTDDED